MIRGSCLCRNVRFELEGGCDCRHVRYRMETAPLFVHCCHCRWRQRESGAFFALDAMIEADRVTVMGGEPELNDTPSASGYGQKFARCPQCRIALWSNYAGARPLIRFVRVGTLDLPDHLPPRHPHLHCLEAALDGHPARHAGGAGILRTREALAGRKSCPKTGHIAQDRAVSGLPSDRRCLGLGNEDSSRTTKCHRGGCSISPLARAGYRSAS